MSNKYVILTKYSIYETSKEGSKEKALPDIIAYFWIFIVFLYSNTANKAMTVYIK